MRSLFFHFIVRVTFINFHNSICNECYFYFGEVYHFCYCYSLNPLNGLVAILKFQIQVIEPLQMSWIFNAYFETLKLIVVFLVEQYLNLILEVDFLPDYFRHWLNLVQVNLISSHALLGLKANMNLKDFTARMKSCLYFVKIWLKHYFYQNFVIKCCFYENWEDWNYYFALNFIGVNSYCFSLRNWCSYFNLHFQIFLSNKVIWIYYASHSSHLNFPFKKLRNILDLVQISTNELFFDIILFYINLTFD